MTRQQRRLQRAWVIQWGWAGDHAAVSEPFIAVLSSRTSAKKVRDLVQLLYMLHSSSQAEIPRFARSPKQNPYQAAFGTMEMIDDHGTHTVTWEGQIICGHNPWIEARLVANVRPGPGDPEGDILWEEIPHPGPLDLRRAKRHGT
jgi:hypothetical protein